MTNVREVRCDGGCKSSVHADEITSVGWISVDVYDWQRTDQRHLELHACGDAKCREAVARRMHTEILFAVTTRPQLRETGSGGTEEPCAASSPKP